MWNRIVIVAGGWIEGSSFLKEMIRQGDFIIASDGGFSHLRRAGIVPQVIIGDMDSLEEGDYRWAIEKNVDIISHPREKDKTDTELALDHALSMDPGEVIVLGGMGDRIDHTLSNVGLLLKGMRRNVPVYLMDGRQSVFLAEGSAQVEGKEGDWVSLIPMTERVDGIKTEGLKYPLIEGSLFLGKSTGISNELTQKRATINFSSGILIVVHISR